MVPGLPTLPFLVMSIMVGTVAWIMHRFDLEKREQDEEKARDVASKPKSENIETLLPLDLLELEVGYSLIQVVESQNSGDLLERIVSIRKQFALDLGIVVPKVHIRDNLQ
jgi:flagellar biosynthesis protein FlhA